MNKEQKPIAERQATIEAIPMLPAVFVKTRDEAEEQMKLGNKFTATTWRTVTSFNKRILKFLMKKHKYTRSNIKRGLDLYEPVS